MTRALILGGLAIGVVTVVACGAGRVDAATSYSQDFVPQHSGKCLDLYGASQANDALVYQFYCHGETNQQLDVIDKGAGWYEYKFKHSGKCLHAPSTSQGAQLKQMTCNGTTAQRFTAPSCDGCVGQIRNQFTGYCLDVYGAQTGDNVPVIQWSCHGGSNQQFLMSWVNKTYVSPPLASTHHSYVSCDDQCHLDGGRQVGQDLVAHNSDHTKDTSASVQVPTLYGRQGIVVGVWTSDGWHMYQNGTWHYEGGQQQGDCGTYYVTYLGHPWGNGYDIYLSDNSSNQAQVYRFAHMSVDGSYFWQSGSLVYPLYASGNKLAQGQTLGWHGNTGYSCGQHLHWHLSVGSDSARYVPTYSNLDFVGAELGPYGGGNGLGAHAGELGTSCWVNPRRNCDPQGWW